jgi:hypothetical protein
MFSTEVSNGTDTELSPELIREQLELMVQDQVLRSSKRSVQFLRYVVEQTLNGAADQIKERTIGVEVFGRDPSYDTNVDHIVRTAAIELRKRLTIYYGEEKHRSELRMSLVPGSYIPHFAPPNANAAVQKDHETPAELGSAAVEFVPSAGGRTAALAQSGAVAPPRSRHGMLWFALAFVGFLSAVGLVSVRWLHNENPQYLFWKPVLDSNGPVLLAVGDVPNGPPSPSAGRGDQATAIPIIQKGSSPTVPFADTVTIARVVAILESRRKEVIIRRESQSSFSDLRQSPVVLIGAFNNEWSLRLTQQMRYTLALDPEKHLIYIRDAKSPSTRTWSWATDDPPRDQGAVGGPPLQDYALISRIWDSKTGNVVVVIGGLYTYGTEAAGEFLARMNDMQALSSGIPLDNPHRNLQIVLSTTVTDGTAGPPKVVAVSTE